MKKIVILFFAVLAQAVYVFGEGLARELERECAKEGMCVLPDASRARIKAVFEKRIAEIRGTPNMAVPVGAERRYLSESGSDAADGKTPATAWRTTERLEKENLAPGSFALFERGGVYRGGFRASKGVTYTAYGKGAKPRIYSSPENGADPAKWERTDAPNVWRYKIGEKDVGTIVFDGGAAHAIKIIPVYNDDGTYTQQYGGRPFNNGYKDLVCDLHFWHDYSGKTDFKPFAKGTGYLYLYSTKNPGERFKSIEFNVKKHGVAVGGANDVHIDNLCIMYVGSHGVGAGTVKGLRVTNCEFGWIGGSIQSERLFGRKWAVRYGNAVEIWGGCDGFTVDNCYVHDVYDAGLTQQINVEKPDEARDQRHVRYSRNVIENCNYSIEYFLSLKGEARVSNSSRMEDFVIEGNIMRNAGRGFCQQRPDRGQSAHIKSWRNGANRATGYVIRDNVFAFGDEMLVEISSGLANPDGSDSMPEMKGNVFIGREGQRFGVLNQGKPVELKYDRKFASALGARYSGNVFALAAAVAANVPAKVKTVQIADGENWWGAANFFGTNMPFTAKTDLKIDLRRRNYSNQCASLLVSDKGRVVWSDAQSEIVFKDGQISIDADSPVFVETAAEPTLRGAYRHAMRKWFPPSGKSPDARFFTAPQLNTWIELTYHQNQKDILAYAKSMIAHGVPPGVLMIDDTWQAGYGDWRFEPSRFPDPKAMMDELHGMGYKVMLWMCPYVGMDLPAFRRIAWGRNPDDVRGYPAKGGFLTDVGDAVPGEGEYGFREKPKACGWWNGYSAFLDFSHPNANAWFTETLDGLVKDFGVDGFKFDGADLGAYNLSDRRAKDPKATSGSLNNGYCAYALKYPFCEIRNTWRMQQIPVVVRLHDKMHEWPALNRIVADMIAAGLIGQPFICPDMVGGGDWVAFIPGSPFEQELFIRSAQIHALCPMMQISASPWRVLDERHQAIFRDILALRQKFAPMIAALAKKAGEDGEPILRSLEYAYPGRGYAEVLDEFMMGDDLLVAPILEKGAVTRKVVLPPGKWLADDGKTYIGPARITVDAPLGRLPHFAFVP